jgi:hypothetical protein
MRRKARWYPSPLHIQVAGSGRLGTTIPYADLTDGSNLELARRRRMLARGRAPKEKSPGNAPGLNYQHSNCDRTIICDAMLLKPPPRTAQILFDTEVLDTLAPFGWRPGARLCAADMGRPARRQAPGRRAAHAHADASAVGSTDVRQPLARIRTRLGRSARAAGSRRRAEAARPARGKPYPAATVLGRDRTQALRNKCTRLHLTIAETHRRLVLTLPLADQRALAAAAQERGVEPELLAVRVLHCALEVLDAVLDDRDGMAA